MERRARCRICKELISYTDPKELGEHLITQHPSFNPIYFTSDHSPIPSGSKYYEHEIPSCKPCHCRSVKPCANLLPSSTKIISSTKKVSKTIQTNENIPQETKEKSGVNFEDSFYSAFGNDDNLIKKGFKNPIKSILYAKGHSDSLYIKRNKSHKPCSLPKILESNVFGHQSCPNRQDLTKEIGKCFNLEPELKVCRPENCGNRSIRSFASCSSSLCSENQKVCCKQTCPNISKDTPCRPKGKCTDSIEVLKECKSKERKKIKVFNKPSQDVRCNKKICVSRDNKYFDDCSSPPCNNSPPKCEYQEKNTKCKRVSDDKGSKCAKQLISKGKNFVCKKQKNEERSKCKVYKTMVTSWTPGNHVIYCPHCQKCMVPMLRKQRKKFTKHSLAASLLLTCWPICLLLPMNFTYQYKAFCPICNKAIGTYDNKTNSIKVCA